MTRPDVLIIGAGIIGLTLGYELLKRGQTVRLLDQSTAGQGATRAAAGMLATDEELPEPLHELAALSRTLYPELVRQLLDETGLGSGYLEQPFCLHRGNQSLTLEQVGQIDSRLMTQALRRAIQRRGGVIEEDTSVSQLVRDEQRIIGAETNRGLRTGRQIIVASGRGSEAVLRTLGITIDTSPVKGECLSVRLMTGRLDRTLFNEQVYLVPKADGRIIIGATERPGDESTTVRLDSIRLLVNQAIRLYPPLAEAVFVEAWAGVRPQTGDGLPYLGPVDGIDGLFVATGHHRHGILLAPATATVLADCIMGKKPKAMLGAFSHQRQGENTK